MINRRRIHHRDLDVVETAAEAVHLATAVGAGADRFITNNWSDLPKAVTEIDVTYPDDLPDPVRR